MAAIGGCWSPGSWVSDGGWAEGTWGTFAPAPYPIHSPAEVIRQLLIDFDLGTLPSTNGEWPVYSTREPDRKDQMIVTLDQLGFTSGRSMTSGASFDHHGIQIIVRAKDHRTGYARASRIRETLLRSVIRRTVVVDEVPYVVPCINKVSEVLTLGVDAPTTGRSRFSINVTSPVHRPGL
jgi:hypothetical protein